MARPIQQIRLYTFAVPAARDDESAVVFAYMGSGNYVNWGWDLVREREGLLCMVCGRSEVLVWNML